MYRTTGRRPGPRRRGALAIALALAAFTGLGPLATPAQAYEQICDPGSSWYEVSDIETSNEITHLKEYGNHTGTTAPITFTVTKTQQVEAGVTATYQLTTSAEGDVFGLFEAKAESQVGFQLEVKGSRTSAETVSVTHPLLSGDRYVFYAGVRVVSAGWNRWQCNGNGTASWVSNSGQAKSYAIPGEGAVGCNQGVEAYTLPAKAKSIGCALTIKPAPVPVPGGDPVSRGYGVTTSGISVGGNTAACQNWPSSGNCSPVIGTMNVGHTIRPVCQKSGQTVGRNSWWVYGAVSTGVTGWIPSWWIDYPDDKLPSVPVCADAAVTPPAPVGASFTGDARAELVSKSDGFSIWQNSAGQNGSWPWGADTYQGSGWSWVAPAAVWFADLDGDGRKDLVTLAGDSFRVFPHTGAAFGSWPWGTDYGTGSGWSGHDPAAVWFADITGDGRADLVHRSGDQLRYFPNTAGGHGWGAPVTIGTGWNGDPRAIYFADMDGDRRADLITLNGDEFRVWPNANGHTGGWPWGADYGTGSGWSGHDPAAVWFADITGDGRADLVHRSGDQLRYFPNTAGGHGWGGPVGAGTGWNGDPRAIYFA